MRRVWPLFFLLLTLCGTLEAMNAMGQIGYGAKAKGMAGVATAFAQDAFSPITNPATLVRLTTRADLGAGYLQQHGGTREVDIDGVVIPGTEWNSGRDIWYPEVAAVWRVSDCSAFGAAIYVVGALNVGYGAAIPSLSSANPTSMTSLTSYTAAFTPSWALRISNVHTVGFSINMLVSTMNIRGIDAFATPAFSAVPSRVTDQGTDVALGFSVRGGWLICIHKEVQLGASIQTKSWTGKLGKYQGFLADAGSFDYPSRLDLGVAWWPVEKLVLAGDYSLVGWLSSKPFGNRGRGEGGLFGTSAGPGFGWNCQSIVRVGLHWCACPTLVVRLGFNLGVNPIDATQPELNQLTLAQPETHVTVGFTRMCGRGEWSGYYYYAFRKRVTGRDSDLSGGTNNFHTRNTQNGVGIAYGYCY